MSYNHLLDMIHTYYMDKIRSSNTFSNPKESKIKNITLKIRIYVFIIYKFESLQFLTRKIYTQVLNIVQIYKSINLKL